MPETETIETVKYYVNRLQNLLKFLQNESNDPEEEREAVREIQYQADNLRKEMQRRLMKRKKR